jgi:myo-inositol 2-dehydrogenase/D-chiro-inositol 1-dehydrogenase
VREGLGGRGVKVFSTIEEMIDGADLDGVLVAAPTNQHLDIVRRLMPTGLAVLCEKPCGLDVSQAEECSRLAAASGTLLQIAYWRRFVPQLQRLREKVLGGDLGELLAVNCYQWDKLPPPAEFRSSSGGIFVDMGVHEFDQVRWLTGQEFGTLSVSASTVGETATGDPDCAQMVAQLDGGATAMVSLGRWHPAGDSCKVEVFGTTGAETVWFLRPSEGDEIFIEALRRQAENFVRAVSAGGGGGASIGDAVVALSVATRAAQSSGSDPAVGHSK